MEKRFTPVTLDGEISHVRNYMDEISHDPLSQNCLLLQLFQLMITLMCYNYYIQRRKVLGRQDENNKGSQSATVEVKV